MKILVITNLFPNNKEPNRGIFNKQEMLELIKLCKIQVVAPVVWHRAKGILEEENVESPGHQVTRTQEKSPGHQVTRSPGFKVYHPKYFMIPKIGRSLYGFFFYFSLISMVKKIYESFKFDLIFSLWVYPDGFGSFLIAKALRKPIVIMAQGSDINIHTKYFLRRRMIAYILKGSNRVITVSGALKERIIEIGVPEDKISVILNGVNTELFKPMDKIECRKKLNLPLDKKIVLFVGNLEMVKGIDLLVDAMKDLDNICLAIVGDGPLREIAIRNTQNARLKSRVYFAGARPHSEIPIWMNASDIFCLPSRNEGCPNVILEALACGRPIVASRAGGIPEIIKSENQGVLVSPENITELRAGILRALEKDWDSTALRQSVVNFDWKENVKKVFDVLGSAKNCNILYHHRTQGTGAEGVHIVNIIKGFRKSGHRVYVISPPGVDAEKTAGDSPYKKKSGFVRKFFDFLSRHLPQFLFEILEITYNLKAGGRLNKILKNNQIHFIYERYAFFLFAGVRLAKKFNVPIIVEVNEVVGEKRVRRQHFTAFAKRIEKFVFQNADAIVVVSDFLKKKIMEYGISGNKIFVMPNAVDEGLFIPRLGANKIKESYAIKSGAVIIGFIGWFVKWHNIELLLEAFSDAAKKSQALLFLVGDGALKNRFEEIARNMHIEDKVFFPGSIPYENIPDYIDLMDICVIPDSNEYRSPIKLFEYMSMGKAVVAPRYAPIESIVEDGGDAILFEKGNKESLKTALDLLIENPARRKALGGKAREKILKNYTWLGNAERVMEIASSLRSSQ